MGIPRFNPELWILGRPIFRIWKIARFYLESGEKLGKSIGRSDIRNLVRKCSEINETASLFRWGSCWIKYFMASTRSRCPSTEHGSGFRGFALRRAGSGISGVTGRIRTLATDLYLNPASSDAAPGPCAIENVLEICARQK